MPFDMPPTRADLFAWVGGVDGGQAGDVYDLALQTASLGQAADCTWTFYTADLHAACLRRAGRLLAARGLALGRMEGGDFGPAFVPQWDAEIERYEKDYRPWAVRMIALLESLAAAVGTVLPCSVTPWDPRPSGAHAWLDAPTLVAQEGTLVGDVAGGQPDIRVGVHLRASGPDPDGVRRLYAALVDVLVAVPDPWWLSEDVTPEQAGDADSYGYVIPLSTRRT